MLLKAECCGTLQVDVGSPVSTGSDQLKAPGAHNSAVSAIPVSSQGILGSYVGTQQASDRQRSRQELLNTLKAAIKTSTAPPTTNS